MNGAPVAHARRCAVLGSPIAHSVSPQLHRAAYEYLGLAWEYSRHEVTEAGLPAFLADLDTSWRGLSLTMPLKRAALEHVDEASEIAKIVTAVNTILIENDGRRVGQNTDVPGMVAALEERGVGRAPSGAVLGGGATARSAVAALSTVTNRVEVFIRTEARAERLRQLAAGLRVICQVRPWEERYVALRAPIVMSTTPPGVTDDLAATVPESPAVLLDVTYAGWPTALAAAWEKSGGTVVTGLDVLIHQAALQVTAMTGHDIPISVLRTAGETALLGRSD